MTAINPLANPRGPKRLCELCQKPAYLQCTTCRVTFYCDTEHQQADWVGIHERICQLLIPIRCPVPFHSLQDERDQHHADILAKQKQLIEISRAMAQSKLFEGKHQESLPAAQISLRCAMDVYGPSAVELVPAYLLLAEANVGLGSLAQAEEYLSQAEWTVMKTPECSHTVRHKLHRNMGRLFTASGNLEAALLNFANDVYYANEEYGLDNIITCNGYFLMANVFIKQEKWAIAQSLYSEVASTWHAHLTKLFVAQVRGDITQEPCFALLVDTMQPESVHRASLFPRYDNAQRTEADHILRTMLEFMEKNFRMEMASVTLLAHCLAMLWFLGGMFDKAMEFGRRALQASQLVPDHDLTEPIISMLQLADSNPHQTILN